MKNDTPTTIRELSESYEVENIYEYVCESVINGQIKQAKKIASECKEMLDYSYFDLRDVTQMFHTHEDKVIEIFFA